MLLKYFKEQKKMAAVILTAIFFIACDRFFKCLAVNDFLNNKKIIGDFFQFNFVSNYNIAFSLPITGWWLNILIVLIIIVLIYNLLYLSLKERHDQAIFLLIIIFGAVSNLFDRIKFGYVIDYFDLKYWTVFNLADVMIMAGVIGLGRLMVKK
ncbi:MAG: signal peptidase II [Patescibacteria group bacterium]|nr:signal peptidase II [Patescibacteria group bacterium]